MSGGAIAVFGFGSRSTLGNMVFELLFGLIPLMCFGGGDISPSDNFATIDS